MRLFLAVAFLSGVVSAQPFVVKITAEMTPLSVFDLPAADGTQGIAYVIDDADCDPATAGAGIVLCLDRGNWEPVASSGGGGGAPSGTITLDAGLPTLPSLQWPGGGLFGFSTGFGHSAKIAGAWVHQLSVANCSGATSCLSGAAVGAPQIFLGASTPATPNLRPDKADTDTGVGRSTAGGVALTDENVPLLEAELGAVNIRRVERHSPSAQSCVDEGTAGRGSLAIDATATSLVYLTVLDPDGCDVVVLETGAQPDAALEILNVGAYVATLKSQGGTLEAAGEVVLGTYDAMTLRRLADRWVQTGGSDNSIGPPAASYPDADFPDQTQLETFNAFGNVTSYTGGFLAVYRKAGSHIGTRGAVWGITSADGIAWGPEFPIYSHATLDTRDPEVMRTAAGDLLITVVLTDPVTMDLIPDGNRVLRAVDPAAPASTTWTEFAANSTFTGGEASSAPLVEMANGDLLYPVWGRDTGDAYDSSRLLRSVDGGATWSESIIAEGARHYQEPNVLALDDGRLLALLRTGATHYASYSADAGLTWSAPTPAFAGGGAPRFAQVANGALVVTYRAGVDGSTAVRWSSDRGATWSAEALVHPDFHHYGGFVERAPNVAMLAFWGRTSGTVSRGHVTHIDLTGLGPP